MLEIDWDATEGWSAPVIKPMQDLRLHPATSALHYAIQCFEGAKVTDAPGAERRGRLADQGWFRAPDSSPCTAHRQNDQRFQSPRTQRAHVHAAKTRNTVKCEVANLPHSPGGLSE